MGDSGDSGGLDEPVFSWEVVAWGGWVLVDASSWGSWGSCDSWGSWVSWGWVLVDASSWGSWGGEFSCGARRVKASLPSVLKRFASLLRVIVASTRKTLSGRGGFVQGGSILACSSQRSIGKLRTPPEI